MIKYLYNILIHSLPIFTGTLLLVSCSSSILGRGEYAHSWNPIYFSVSKNGEKHSVVIDPELNVIQFIISEDQLVLLVNGIECRSLKIVKRFDRILELTESNNKKYFVSVFNENCFKPRRTRSIIFSEDFNLIYPYSRNTHWYSDFSLASDSIVKNLIHTNKLQFATSRQRIRISNSPQLNIFRQSFQFCKYFHSGFLNLVPNKPEFTIYLVNFD